MPKLSIASLVAVMVCVACQSCKQEEKKAPAPPAPPKPAAPVATPLPESPPPEPPAEPLEVLFTGEHVTKLGGYEKECGLDPKTGGLELKVGGRPMRAAADAQAGCCVVFRNLGPGGRRNASAVLDTRRAEPGLTVKLESFRAGHRQAVLLAGQARPGSTPIETAIDDRVLATAVDRMCVSVSGKRGAANLIRVSGLRFF